MKLAVSTYSLWQRRVATGETLEDSIDWIAESGVTAIEFSGLDDKAPSNPLKRAGQLRKRCEKRGLKIANYSVGGEFLRPASAQRKVIEETKLQVDVAATLGVLTMRHDVTYGWNDTAKGIAGPQTFGNALKVIAPAIREVTEYAAGLGIKTSLENHGFYMQASERVEKLLRAVNHPNYGLTLDMGNFLCVNEDPVKAVARLARYAIMVHAKDFHVKPRAAKPPTGWFDTPTPIALRGAIIGHGVIDVPRQLALVKQAGYKGYLSLEFEGMEEPTFGIKTGLSYLTEQLKAIKALQ